MPPKVECIITGCGRKGRSAGEFICPEHWVIVPIDLRRKIKHAQKVARRSPLPINVAVVRKLWDKAIAGIEEVEANAG